MMGGLRFFSMDSEVSGGELEEGVRGLGDFAVLVRAAVLAEPIRKAFDDHAIPYQLVGERSYLETEPCRSILELLALLCRPDDGGLRRRVRSRARALGRSGDFEASLEPLLGARLLPERIRAASRWLGLTGQGELSQVQRLLEAASSYADDPSGFLRLVRLGSPADDYTEASERVTLMTLHAAKGLEFRCVFIAGCEDGILPFTLAPGRSADLEEERRLLYVGATRAARLLVLTHARKRRLYGRTVSLPRSRFLTHLDELSFDERVQAMPRRKAGAQQLELGLGGRSGRERKS
jgi:superfamily I DNA/RNA helicase